MSPDDVEEWLENWVDENLQTAGLRDKSSSMSSETERCRADAKIAGISDKDLMAASGGNLEEFLLSEQNAITDAETGRLPDQGD